MVWLHICADQVPSRVAPRPGVKGNLEDLGGLERGGGR